MTTSDRAPSIGPDVDDEAEIAEPGDRWERVGVVAAQIGIIATFLLLWEFLPRIPAVRDSSAMFNPLFISSPTEVADKLVALVLGTDSTTAPVMWPYVGRTMAAAAVGAVVGMLGGIVMGLLLSNYDYASKVIRPLLVGMNAVPRIALIPVIIIVFGATFLGSVATAVLVVFFVSFFNAFEGGRSVDREILENVRLLGASQRQVMLTVRLPHVIEWSFASLPLVVTFSLIAVVTSEILTGYRGLGRLIIDSLNFFDTGLTFAVVIVLAVIGLIVVGIAEATRSRLLHWRHV